MLLPARGLCGTCGCTFWLAGDVLPRHDKLGLGPCEGSGGTPRKAGQ